MKMQAINYDNLTVRSSNEDLTIPSLNNTTFVVHELSPQLTLKKTV